MADRKISDLTALTTPASGDYLPIVDISETAAASKNKRITIEELFRGVPLGTAAAPSIAIEGDENTGIYSPGADQLAISTNGTGRLFVASDGRLLVGTSASRTDLIGPPLLQLEGANDSGKRFMSLTYGQAGVSGPYIFLAKHRSDSVGGTTVVQANDQLGAVSFYGHDGTDFEEGARIQAFVDGTPGNNDLPTRLVFSVTADGASAPTEAMRIKNSHIINIANTPVYADNAAAKTGGLVDGDVYRTSTGDLKIVYT